MQPIETEGKTVKDAIDAALRECGLRRDQVEITVIQESSGGFMGIGAKPAKVRLTEKRWGPDTPAPAPSAQRPAPQSRPSRPAPSRAPAPRRQEAPRTPRPEPRPEPRPARPEPAAAAEQKPISKAEAAEACAKAEKLVLELLGLMGVAAPTASTAWDADLERVKITVESQDATLLVGRDGRVLESLQFLATLILSRAGGAPVAVQVDALSYWEKREQAVLDEARRAIESVKATGKPVRLEPMDASMRRLVHRTFGSSPDVTTSSEGEGPWRKLVIRARNG
jgi:spoIIIJ-associated protein